ncbi:hypothetical protein JCM16138_04690 [Thermococcus atlanticus]
MSADLRAHSTQRTSGDAIGSELVDKAPNRFRQRFAEQRTVLGVL